MATTVPNPYAIGYDFPVAGTVFCVIPVTGTNGIHGVNEAVVSAITINVTQSGPIINYDIAFKNSMLGSMTVLSNQLYPDVDAALAAYRSLVLTH